MPHFLTEPYVQSRPYDRAANMFIPDHIPANAYRKPQVESGVHVLMRAVLTDAIECVGGHMTGQGGSTVKARSRRGKRIQKETLEWIFSDDTSYLFSFLSICDYLYLDASAIRTMIQQKQAGKS